MAEWSTGTVRKARGKWQGILSRQNGHKREQITKLFDIPSDANSNKGRPAALKALAQWRTEVIDKADIPESSRQAELTVADYLESYTINCSVHTEASTVYGYRYIIRRQITPYKIASVPLGKLEPPDIRTWLAEASEDFGPTTVNKAFVFLRSALRQAVNDGELPRNPSDGVKPPKRPSPKPNAITEEQRGKLAAALASAEQTPDIIGMRMAFYTGMREGEVCALRWRNVDFGSRTLSIREAVGKNGGKLYIKEPKTSGSRRIIPIPETLAAILRNRKTEMIEQCATAGVAFSPDMFVLGYIDRSDVSGDYRFLHPHVLWERWRVLSSLLGLTGTQGKSPTFHDLRHTFATTAIAEGVDVKTVSSTLGHSNAAMTLNIYADADPDAKRRAAEAVAAALERNAPKAASASPSGSTEPI